MKDKIEFKYRQKNHYSDMIRIVILTFTMSITLLLSCNEKEEYSNIAVDNAMLVLENGEDNQTFNIIADGSWVIEFDSDTWVNLNKTQGKGNSEIIVTTQENTLEEERSLDLIIKSSDKSIIVTIKQSAKQKDTRISGKVIKVADGDTFTILTKENEQIRVRFYGIDAPERKQDYGTKSRNFVNELVYGKMVKIEDKGIDRYKRLLGVIWIDGINLNEALLENGLAWHYKQFDKSKRYAELEEKAKKNKLNIWSQENPIAPWEFRKKKK